MIMYCQQEPLTNDGYISVLNPDDGQTLRSYTFQAGSVNVPVITPASQNSIVYTNNKVVLSLQGMDFIALSFELGSPPLSPLWKFGYWGEACTVKWKVPDSSLFVAGVMGDGNYYYSTISYVTLPSPTTFV